MITIDSLIKRMKKANPNVKCGIEFNCNVTLWWQVSPAKRYEITLNEHQLTVDNHEFQRVMMQAEIDMRKNCVWVDRESEAVNIEVKPGNWSRGW